MPILPRSGVPVKVPEQLIEALGGNPSSGMCCCPAHDDETPSLSVSETPAGKVLVHCFAGCSQNDVLDALRARGLWPIGKSGASPCIATPTRSYDERRQYALQMLANARGLKTVLPLSCDGSAGFRPDNFAMLFEVLNWDGAVVGCHSKYLVGGDFVESAFAIVDTADAKLRLKLGRDVDAYCGARRTQRAELEVPAPQAKRDNSPAASTNRGSK
jgi:hypothetical protein